MKKLVSLFLALALILSLSVTAFAEETTSVTITGDDARIYAGYQLLALTTSLKSEKHHPETCDGTNHTDDCYNYAYTVNTKYRAILQAETLDNGRNELWSDAGKPTVSANVTDEQILKYLEGQTSGNGTMRQVADWVYRAILAANIAADEPSLTGNNDAIAQGYWMFADVTDLGDDNAANSLVMVDTAGHNAITITPKTAIPTVEKKVKDIEDSEDDSITDNPWQDTADHDIGDSVPFKLTGTLPSNAQSFTSYMMVFHDQLSAGLTLDASSIKVYMYDTKHKADVDTDMNAFAKDVTAFFSAKTADLADGCSFEVGCANVFGIEGVTKDTVFVVYYEATLNDNAAIGAAGNPNEVYLEFSNNPYDEGTGETEKDKVIVFTYQMVVNKTDSHGHELEGAGFTLYKKDLSGTYNALGEELKGEDMTTFTWKGLDDGDYKLEETTVPEGYNQMEDIFFSISAEHTNDPTVLALTSLDGGLMGTGEVSTGTITKNIVNNTGTVLPETGAQGTFLLISVSTLFVMVAAVFMVTRKKMSIYED